jgi:hypothetical protein
MDKSDTDALRNAVQLLEHASLAARLRVAELVARGLNGFVENSVEAVRINNELRLPAFRFGQLNPYTWPRSR